MLRVIRRHTHESVFQAMRVLVTHCKAQKQVKKVAKDPKGSLARPPIYKQAYPENSRLLLQAIQWASTNSVRFYCATGYKVFGTLDKGK